ncbi:NACHT domain-containing protein [Actinoplanes sp. GCM10030250]|uniref:NACHT domain-containing protein n=1 Tax=Actinoplanes sp. GCM10030250 TaxID=3273376 RepID=UPI0036136545
MTTHDPWGAAFLDGARSLAAITEPALLPLVNVVADGHLTDPRWVDTTWPAFLLIRPANHLSNLLRRLGSACADPPTEEHLIPWLDAHCTVSPLIAAFTAFNAVKPAQVLLVLPSDTRYLTRGAETSVADYEHTIVQALLTLPVPRPRPDQTRSDFFAAVGAYLSQAFELLASLFGEELELSGETHPGPMRHLHGRLPRGSRGPFRDEVRRQQVRLYRDELLALAPAVLRAYISAFNALAVRYPQVGLWAGPDRNTDPSQELLPGQGLRAVQQLLSTVGRLPGQPESALTRALLRARETDVEQPIIDAADLLMEDGMNPPPLKRSYLDPRFRATLNLHGAPTFEERWWHSRIERCDLAAFLAGCFTHPEIARFPVVVFGDPGSGKSVFMRALGAVLAVSGYLPVLVRLRYVPADDAVVKQIEHAVLDATNRAAVWDEVVSSTTRTVVVLLDGFDELLQSSSTNRADYLDRISQFQSTEWANGNPILTVVTSRIAVAHRFHVPVGSAVLKLLPFDRAQSTRWLDSWQTSIAPYLAKNALQPLTIDTVWRYRELAEQPLMLLLLALHDANGNRLQNNSALLTASSFYEQLIHGFIERELRKHRRGESAAALAGLIDAEIERLCVAAFGMFNRSRQSVFDTELDADLLAFAGSHADPSAMRALWLSPGERLVSRFFFIHVARSTVRRPAPNTSMRIHHSYEFMHATFGEYLVARFVSRSVAGLTAPAEDERRRHADLLYTVLSYRPLTAWGRSLEFLAEMLVGQMDTREAVAHVCRAFRDSVDEPAPGATKGYQPAQVDVLGRMAAYSLNLVILLSVIEGGLVDVRKLCPAVDPVGAFRRIVAMWQAGLDTASWRSFRDEVAVVRTGPHSMAVGLVGSTALPAGMSGAPPHRTVLREAPAVRQVISQLESVHADLFLSPFNDSVTPGGALLRVLSANGAFATQHADDPTPCDADYLDCISTVYELPPHARRYVLGALRHQLGMERRNVRNRALLEAAIDAAASG